MKQKPTSDKPDPLYLRIVLFLCGLTMGGGLLLLGIVCASKGDWCVAMFLFTLAALFLAMLSCALWARDSVVQAWSDALPFEWLVLAFALLAYPIYWVLKKASARANAA